MKRLVGLHFFISTDLLQLRIERKPQLSTPQLRAEPGQCTIFLPSHHDCESPAGREWLYRAVVEALRQQAHALLAPRVAQHAQRASLAYQRLCFKNMASRWGSCSSLRNLNFSIWLLLAPSPLIDYVICHELAHLVELNHSAEFWKVLDGLLGEKGLAKRMDKQMNHFARSLFQTPMTSATAG